MIGVVQGAPATSGGHWLPGVAASPTPISYKGEYHFRSGSTKQQLTGNALSTFLLRKFGRTWDGAPVPNVAVKDLNAEAFKAAYLDPAIAGSLIEMTSPDKPSSRLQRYRLTEAGKAKVAAKRGGRR